MHRIGAVSYLNSRPLIAGLELEQEIELETDVPSRLLGALLSRRLHLALCPTIDYQLAPTDLCIVPVGAIGSKGATLTVRIFSRVPLSKITRVRVDTDSHTSVALLQIVLAEFNGQAPEVILGNLRETGPLPGDEAVLLIGDKVITSAPSSEGFPYQLDLGEAWQRITDLPFVFAAWMAHVGTDLGPLPSLLEEVRHRNLGRLQEIVEQDAAPLGWQVQEAHRYLADLLCFDLGAQQLEAMELFWRKCQQLELIDLLQPLRLYGTSPQESR